MELNKVFLWIDDVRPINFNRVPLGYERVDWAENYDQAIVWLKKFMDEKARIIVDFDHDLGEGKSGYDIAKWIVEQDYRRLDCHFRIHSMNPVGAKNIRELMCHYHYGEYGETWKEIFEKNGAEGIDFVPLTFNKDCPQNFQVYASYTKKEICENYVATPRTNYVFWVIKNDKKVYI